MQACWSLIHALPEVHAIEPWANSPSLIYKQKFRDMYNGFIKTEVSPVRGSQTHKIVPQLHHKTKSYILDIVPQSPRLGRKANRWLKWDKPQFVVSNCIWIWPVIMALPLLLQQWYHGCLACRSAQEYVLSSPKPFVCMHMSKFQSKPLSKTFTMQTFQFWLFLLATATEINVIQNPRYFWF